MLSSPIYRQAPHLPLPLNLNLSVQKYSTSFSLLKAPHVYVSRIFFPYFFNLILTHSLKFNLDYHPLQQTSLDHALSSLSLSLSLSVLTILCVHLFCQPHCFGNTSLCVLYWSNASLGKNCVFVSVAPYKSQGGRRCQWLLNHGQTINGKLTVQSESWVYCSVLSLLSLTL